MGPDVADMAVVQHQDAVRRLDRADALGDDNNRGAGQIFLEGLRIGEYKISEVNNSASAMYILPADKEAAVQTGSTTVVEMHNELRDTPKTGDDSKLGLWLVLAGVSAAGIAACGILGFKKKKKKEGN